MPSKPAEPPTPDGEVGERTRLLELQAQIGSAIAANDTLAGCLQACAEALVQHLGAAFARIWTLSEVEPTLELQASAGMYTHLDGPHSRVPVGKFKIGLIAEERAPHLTNQVVGDPRVGNQDWAKSEGMVAFAGYPLLVGEKLVGVVALFARRELTTDTLKATAAIATGMRDRQNHPCRRRSSPQTRRRDRVVAVAPSISGDSAEICRRDWD